ncbi:MAG: PadR family transcriptional regulator [Rhodobacter sp.]|nr:PadR family transcriptional regulator [Paracoccaceae bacterium]MCC0076359.1 PadR family transcriptional regulator [Rhodobacter sp.]
MAPETGPEGAEVRLNPLGYQILGVIARAPVSGYDVMKALHRFRPVRISQVYASLAVMEAAQLVRVHDVMQQGKPNKRVHEITPKGGQVLDAWIAEPTAHPAQNDEFVRKVYSLWHAPTDERRRLIRDRQAWLRAEVRHFEQMQADLTKSAPGHDADPGRWEFSRGILLKRRLALMTEELRWCESVLALLSPNPEI